MHTKWHVVSLIDLEVPKHMFQQEDMLFNFVITSRMFYLNVV